MISRSYLPNPLLLPDNNPLTCVNFWSGVDFLWNLPPLRAKYGVVSHFIRSATIWSQTLKLFPPSGCKLRPGSFSCDTCDVVYLITCSLCPTIPYIGQTSTSFRLRFNKHKSSIRLNKAGFPVAEHFNLPDHSLNNLKFAILHRGNLTDTSKRTLVETQLIHRTGPYVHGLNRDFSFLSGFNFYK